MLRRLKAYFIKDQRLLLRNHFYTATALLALLYLGILSFYTPPEILPSFNVGAEEVNPPGLVLSEPPRLVLAGYESQRQEAIMVALVGEMLRGGEGVPTQILQPQAPPRPEPPLSFLPLLILLEAGLMGVMLAAAQTLMEREERSLQALRATPGPVWEWILMRALALSVPALGFTVLITLVMRGLEANYLLILPAVFLGSLMSTWLGMAVSIHLQTLSQFLIPAVGLILVLALPALALLIPSWEAWVWWMPTFQLARILQVGIFPGMGTAPFWPLGLWTVLLGLGSYLRIGRVLVRV